MTPVVTGVAPRRLNDGKPLEIATMHTYRHMTDEEQAAVQRFANAHGRKWRNELNNIYWYNARLWSGGEPLDGSLLHGLRNDLGPTWLYAVCKIKPAKS